jgi:hypothetical protein
MVDGDMRRAMVGVISRRRKSRSQRNKMPVPRVVVTFTIPAGQSLSQGVDCTDGYFARIQMPGEWTSANLSFQVSDDGQTYYDLVDKWGNESLIPVRAGTAVMIHEEPWSSAIGWWKLRSGSRWKETVQEDARTFKVTLAPS